METTQNMTLSEKANLKIMNALYSQTGSIETAYYKFDKKEDVGWQSEVAKRNPQGHWRKPYTKVEKGRNDYWYESLDKAKSLMKC